MEFFNHRRSLFAPNQTICCTSGCPGKCFFSFPQATDENQKHLPPLVIVIAAAIGTVFLLVSYYAIIVRYCSYWNITRRRSSRNQETREDYLDEGHGRVVDHPIWRIATVGLEQSIINSIPICLYKKEDGLVEGNDCSICLSEFEEDETLRLLPKCSHAFHLPCIDMWLASHTNCPLCRAPIVSISTGPDSTAENLNNSSPQVALQIETSGREEGGSSEMNGQTEEHGRGEREIVKEDVSTPKANSDFLVPMRRSISMDFIRSLALAHSVEAEGSSGVQAERGKKLKGKLSQKSPISMKRSFSSGAKVFLSGSMKRSVSSGAKVFLSRHTRDRSSILPL